MNSELSKYDTRLGNFKELDSQYALEIKNKKGDYKKCADPRIVRSLLILMNQMAVNGGAACHWGGPAAMTEMNSALHSIILSNKTWYEKFNYINDIGHAENGIYALRSLYNYANLTPEELLNFRSSTSRLTGHGEHHLFPEQTLFDGKGD